MIKDEPEDWTANIENLPRPNIEEPVKKAGRPKRVKKLAPLSPDGMNSPAEPVRSLRVTRARAARK